MSHLFLLFYLYWFYLHKRLTNAATSKALHSRVLNILILMLPSCDVRSTETISGEILLALRCFNRNYPLLFISPILTRGNNYTHAYKLQLHLNRCTAAPNIFGALATCSAEESRAVCAKSRAVCANESLDRNVS